MTDKELVQGIQSGNREALEIMIEKYYNDIYYKQQKESLPLAEIPDLARSDHTCRQRAEISDQIKPSL